MVAVVSLHVCRPRRQVVAAHVGCDDAKARVREWLDLQPPAEPELREAVQQNDQRPFTHLEVMQADVADVGVALTKFCPVQIHTCEASPAVGPCQLPAARYESRWAPQRRRPGTCAPPRDTATRWLQSNRPMQPGEAVFRCYASRGERVPSPRDELLDRLCGASVDFLDRVAHAVI